MVIHLSVLHYPVTQSIGLLNGQWQCLRLLAYIVVISLGAGPQSLV